MQPKRVVKGMSLQQSARPLTSIAQLTTAVFDTGRRGAPRPGCDCVQCFGYCLTDPEAAIRESFERGRRSDANELGITFGGEK